MASVTGALQKLFKKFYIFNFSHWLLYLYASFNKIFFCKDFKEYRNGKYQHIFLLKNVLKIEISIPVSINMNRKKK